MNFKIKKKQLTLLEALQAVAAVVNQSFDEEGTYYPLLCEVTKKGLFVEMYTDYEFQDDVEENYLQYAGIQIENYRNEICYEQWIDMEKAISKEIEVRLKQTSTNAVFQAIANMMEDFGKGFNLEKSEMLLEKLSQLKDQLPSSLTTKEVS